MRMRGVPRRPAGRQMAYNLEDHASRLAQIRNAEYHVPQELQGKIVVRYEWVMSNVMKRSHTI